MTTTQQTNENFFKYFQQEAADLQEQIDKLATHSATGGEVSDAIEHCSAGIARLSNEVRDLLDSLPSHDRQTYSSTIQALSVKLQTARGQASRKQKFSFKRSAFKIPKNESAVSLHDAPELAQQRRIAQDQSHEEADAPSVLSLNSPMPPSSELGSIQSSSDQSLLQRQDEYIAAGQTQLALLVDISRSIIDLSGAAEPYPTFRLRNISHSIVMLPNVTGPVYLEKISHSIILAGCHQFRMHDSESCEVYLYCSSRPIVEDCSSITFAPMPTKFAQSGRAENRWDQVDDFKWLRPDQSPHWSLLASDQQRQEEFWTHVQDLQGSENVGVDINALGLP